MEDSVKQVIPVETAERHIKSALHFLSVQAVDRVIETLFKYPINSVTLRKSIKVMVGYSQESYKKD